MIRWLRRPRGMTCQEVAVVLQHYLDHEVEDGTARRVSLHLVDCQHCGVEYTVYREIKDTLVQRGQASVDPAVLATLRRFCDDLAEGRVPPAEGDR